MRLRTSPIFVDKLPDECSCKHKSSYLLYVYVPTRSGHLCKANKGKTDTR